jgi:hypothetical protein
VRLEVRAGADQLQPSLEPHVSDYRRPR